MYSISNLYKNQNSICWFLLIKVGLQKYDLIMICRIPLLLIGQILIIYLFIVYYDFRLLSYYSFNGKIFTIINKNIRLLSILLVLSYHVLIIEVGLYHSRIIILIPSFVGNRFDNNIVLNILLSLFERYLKYSTIKPIF